MAVSLYYKVFSFANKAWRPSSSARQVINSPAPAPQQSSKLTLLLLHGYLASQSNMLGVLNALRRYYDGAAIDCYLIDLRNHGRSPHDDDISYPALASDIEALGTLNKLEKVVIIGHSMGGKLAMELAARARLAIAKLIIGDIAPCAYAAAYSEAAVAKLYESDLRLFASRAEFDAYLKEFIPNPLLRGFLLKNLRSRSNHNAPSLPPHAHVRSPSTQEPGKFPAKLYWQCNLKALYEQRQAVISATTLPKPLSAYQATLPVLFIRGENSPYIGEREKKYLGMYFPHYKLLTFENTGHWVHFQHPQRFARAVYDFITHATP